MMIQAAWRSPGSPPWVEDGVSGDADVGAEVVVAVGGAEGVGDGVVVDDEVAWLGVVLHPGGFAGAGWPGDEGDGELVAAAGWADGVGGDGVGAAGGSAESRGAFGHGSLRLWVVRADTCE